LDIVLGIDIGEDDMKKFYLLMIVAVLFTFGVAFASSIYVKTKVVDAQNLWTDPIPVSVGCRANIRIHPDTNSTMTIHAQCRYKGETDWFDMDHWDLTATSVDIIHTTAQPEPELAQIRLGCKTGGYTSGNCTLRVGTGRLP
jgi:hypothetical protein